MRKVVLSVLAALFGIFGIALCAPGIFMLWIAGTIALRVEEL